MFIQNLRASTANCHKKLELNDLSLALLSDNVDENIYSSYLIQLYCFIKGFEQFVYPVLTNHFYNVDHRKKVHLIEEDLKVCNIPHNKCIILEESFFKEIYPDINSAAGGLYVLEGSTLGGQIIVKHLQKKLSHGFINSTYFSAYRHKTGSMWKEFLQQLTALPQSAHEEEQIIAGAIVTFQIIDGLLCNTSPKISTHEN